MSIPMHFELSVLLQHWPAAILLFTASTLPSLTQERDRSKIPSQYKWDVTALYPSDQTWRVAKERLVSELPSLQQFRGTLADSASQLASVLETQSRLEKELTRLAVYASLISDEDTRVSTYQGMQQEMIQVGSELGAET